MIAFRPFFKQVERLVADNSPAILTGIGVAGVVATAYLTGRASIKYIQDLGEEGYFDRDYKFERSPREHLEKAWKLYIPAVGTGLMTVTCIIAANRIGNRRAAAIAAAYSLSERAFETYRDKVVESIGERKEELVRAGVAQDHLNANPPSSSEVVIIGSGEVLVLEAFTGRYFMSAMETLRAAQNQINENIINSDFQSLSDFYDLVGLRHTTFSGDVGWNTDKLMDIRYATAMSNDGRPCLTIDYTTVPIRNYDHYH